MANAVVDRSFHVAQTHRQDSLSAIEGLNLRLLIDREHNRLIRKVQIKLHHIKYLFNKEGIAG